MKKSNLKLMPYAQACVYTDDNGDKILKSYETYVAVLTHDGNLSINGLYSPTTRRHISAFMRENGSDYQTAKSIYEHHCVMNIYTGEVVTEV